MARPVFFSMAIILLAFIPVFALTGQEGKLFHPLAFTKTFAVLAATVIAVTLVPVLCTLLLGGRFHSEDANPVMRLLRAAYQPILRHALDHRGLTVAAAALLFVGALFLARGIGSEFMPALNEGDLMFMPIADPSISLEENTKIAARQNAALMNFPEVDYVVAKVARAETSTDPAPLNMTETIVHLKPRDHWRPGMTLDRLRAEMSDAVQLPGVANIWTMPIINRIDMLTTGIRSEVGVKIFGTDLDVLEGLARKIAESVRRVPGASNVYPGAGDEWPVPEYQRRSRRGRPFRGRHRRHSTGHRNGDRRDNVDHDNRRPRGVFPSGCGMRRSTAPTRRRWVVCSSPRLPARRCRSPT